MEVIAQLEERFETLLRRLRELEEKNQRLERELEEERGVKQEVQARIELLLAKLQGELK
jgi:cell division protein ZapB